MKLRKLLFRDKAQAEVDEAELWYVRWQSRYGEFSSNTKPELKAFPDKDDAEEFAQALRDAFKLIKHTSGNSVTVSKDLE